MKKKTWIWLIFLVLRFFIAYSIDISFLYRCIDCGNNVSRYDDKVILWVTDESFTQSGINALTNSTIQTALEMNTLRFFPDGAQKNCYDLPVLTSQRYLVRAGFNYGNYDGLSSPPTFDLYLDGKKWSTVDTLRGSIFHEAIYTTRDSGHLSLCLLQTKKVDIPFISSIEVVPLPSNVYSHMEADYSFILVSRANLGGDEVRYTGPLSDEKHFRVWTRGEIPPNCIKVPTLPDFSFTLENEPPYSVMSDSIQSRNAADSIILSVDLPQGIPTPQSAYFVFYFNELISLPSSNRIIEIYIDGQMKSTVTLVFSECKVVTINAVTVIGPIVNVKLGTVNDSTLPAIISAMEVFIRGESYIDDQGKNLSSTIRVNFLSAYVMLIYFVWFMFNQCGDCKGP